MPQDLDSWSARRMRRDARLGFGLVVLFIVSMMSTVGTLDTVSDGTVFKVALVALGLFTVDLTLFLPIRRRGMAPALVVFPLLLWAGIISLATVTDGVFAMLTDPVTFITPLPGPGRGLISCCADTATQSNAAAPSATATVTFCTKPPFGEAPW